jgi:uncharacterized repeat protein (TIGR04076 family)
MLEIEVVEVRGHCPVYRVGDKIVIDDPVVVLEKTDALCTHALSSLLHYVLVLERDPDSAELGLTKPGDSEHAYIQCVDPGEPYTKGGTVVFRLRRAEKEKPENEGLRNLVNPTKNESFQPVRVNTRRGLRAQ